MNLESAIVELYRRAATELPPDVLLGLSECLKREKRGSLGAKTLKIILENARIAKEKSRPICQDTGTPIFFVKYGPDFRQKEILEAIWRATERASREVPMRGNRVLAVGGLARRDSRSGAVAQGDLPVENDTICYFDERDEKGVEIGLLLKGGGSENVSMTYTLPNKRLRASRDLDGIRRCVLDSVVAAQGRGCPPMIASVVAGSPEDLVVVTAKRQLLREIGSVNPDPSLAAFEKNLTRDINELGIGPGGFGGKSTVMATFVTLLPRHPASFFVHVSYFCWASRRGVLKFSGGKARFL